MTDSKRTKKRQTLMEGFNNVPKILEEARQAVDAVTRAVPDLSPTRMAAGVSESGTRQALPGTSGQTVEQGPEPFPETGTKKSPGPERDPQKMAGLPLSPATEGHRTPLRSLDYYGIKIRHRLPGRVRLHIPKIQSNPLFAEKIKRGLAKVQGILDVEASAATGSLLLIFDPRELAAPHSRQDFSTFMEGFFPGLDTSTLIRQFF